MNYKNNIRTILVSLIGIGIFSFTSFAVAQDKHAARFPVRGVQSSPTFGMTESEKQVWQEEKETIAMCLKEYVVSGEYYNNESGNETYYMEAASKYTSGYMILTSYVAQEAYHNGNNIETGVLYKSSSTGRYSPNTTMRNKYMGEKMETVLSNSGTPRTEYYYYSIILEEKTQNYDWCVNNGYSTKNN
jgi:hypothetical protein